MHKRMLMLTKLTGRALSVANALTGALVLASLMTANAWAQSTGSRQSAASVDESFSALHRALSAKATNLLADAQRPALVAHSTSETSPASSLEAPSELPNREQIEPNVPRQRALERLHSLQPTVAPILREEGIPPQMAAVVLVESGGRIDALSPKGARGLWQLMPGTARRYGLTVTPTYDERLDASKSTRTAARYLRDLYTQFRDWPLALAAYNAGEDAVERAIDRAKSRDFKLIAQEGTLPVETQNYVPAVLNAMGGTRGISARYASTGARQSKIAAIVYAADHLEN
jgi:soluble lytic murein transglycosylase-like protein